MSKEVMKLALEALEENHHLIEAYERPEYLAQYDRVISAASKALAEQPAQQEPAPGYCKHCKQYTIEEPLPAQRIWVGLVWGELPEDGHDHDFLRGATWAEAKLKEKNT